VRVRVHFYIRDPNPTRVEPGLGVRSIFFPRVHPKPKKTLKKTQNPKKPETERSLKTPEKKTRNPKEI
jgi:hypothetical protein